MARGRWISPSFFDDPVLARCEHGARLLFVACWQMADRSGVFEFDLYRVRKYAFGYEDITIETLGKMFDSLGDGGHVKFGEHDGKSYGLVLNLDKHQVFHKDEKAKLEHIKKEVEWRSARCEHGASTVPAALSLCTESSVLSLCTESETLTGDRDPPRGVPAKIEAATNAEVETRSSLTAPSAPVSRPKRKHSPELQAKAKTIAEQFAAGYELHHGRAHPWGKREWGQLYQLLGSWKADDLIDLVPRWFAWRNHDVIRSAHQWGKGPHCFVLKVGELAADVTNPQRRAVAAVAVDLERIDNKHAQSDAQIERVVKARLEKQNAIGSSESSGSGNSGANLGGNASTQPVGLGSGHLAGRAPAIARPGAYARAEGWVPPASDAWRAGELRDDPGSDEA